MTEKWKRQDDGTWERKGGGDRILWAFTNDGSYWRGGVRYGVGGEEVWIVDQRKLADVKQEMDAWEAKAEAPVAVEG